MKMKRLLQHIIVRTDVWPLAWAYRACYSLAVKTIVRNLEKHSEIVAVYLVSGIAADSCVPGLSDIDIVVICSNAPGSKDKASLCYAKLCRMIPLLNKSEQGIFNLEEIKKIHTQSNSFYKYDFFIKCKKQGKLLCGKDVLYDIEEFDAAEKNELIIGQLGFTWMVLLNSFLIKNKNDDALIRNYYCYKLTSYSCGALIWACYGQEIFNRRKALEFVLPRIDAVRQTHITSIISLMDKRFFGDLIRIDEDTYDFYMSAFEDSIGAMPAIPKSKEDHDAYDHRNYDLATFDFILSDVNKGAIETFVDLVRQKFSQYVSSVLVSPLDLLHIKEQKIGVFITPNMHLPFNIIKELAASLKTSKPCPQQLLLYMIKSDIVIPLNSIDTNQIQSSFFSLQLTSPLSLYLSSPAAMRYRNSLPGQMQHTFLCSKKIVTNYFWQDLHGSIAQDRIAMVNLINDKLILRSTNIEFQALFWQAMQLYYIENSFNLGKLFIPLSSKQVCQRCQEAEGFKLPWLKEFHDQYIKDLNGIPSDSEVYFTRALAFLKKMYALDSDMAGVKR